MAPKRGVHPLRRSALSDLAHALETLAKSTNRQERGLRFEDLLGEYFRRQGLKVRKSPPATRPRQTDLLLYAADDFRAICSAKWERRRIGTSEVDAVRLRLERMPKGTLGLLFSMSEYAKGVAEYAAGLRGHFDILLFSMPEIAMLIDGQLRLRELVQEKRDVIALDGTMLFRPEGPGLAADICGVDLPGSTARFRAGKRTDRLLTIPGESDHIVFGYRIQPAVWGTNGQGVRLDVSLPAQTLDELEAFVHTLPSMVGLSERSTFSIHQSRLSWHGHGLRGLLRACRSRKARYANHAGPFHETEDCVFFSNTRSGWMVLTFQVDSRLRLHYPLMEIRIPGIPLDARPYEELSRWAGYPLFFEPVVAGNEMAVIQLRRECAPRLEVLSLITDESDSVVRGLVAKNPFRGSSIQELGSRRLLSADFLRMPKVICTVSDMHDSTTMVDHYFIRRIQTIENAVRKVVEITCTWNRTVEQRPRAARNRRKRCTDRT